MTSAPNHNCIIQAKILNIDDCPVLHTLFLIPKQVNIKGKEIEEETEKDDNDGDDDAHSATSDENPPEDLETEALEVLYDDSDEEEISFITPPRAKRMSLSKSLLENSLSTSVLGATPSTSKNDNKKKAKTKSQKAKDTATKKNVKSKEKTATKRKADKGAKTDSKKKK